MNERKVKITVKGFGTMIAELYPEMAPKTVENFVKLVKEGFYAGTIFHRVIPGFMIQGGGFTESHEQKHADAIPGEFRANGFAANTLKHTRGVLSMARTMDPNSASSQIFVMHENSPHLDGQYAAFGKVIEGDEVIDAIANVATTTKMFYYQDWPIDDVVIESMELLED